MSDSEAMPMDAVKLMTGIMAASASQNYKMVDSLYEREREERQVLEVHLEDALARFAKAHSGTVREYEAAVSFLAWKPVRCAMTEEAWQALLAKHPENYLR